jgi:phosphosulfolactate synthase
MIDWGLPPASQQDLLGFAGEFLDLAKIAVGISGLIPEAALEAKLDSYRAHGVEPFPGGQFLEYAYQKEQVEAYFEECHRVGYRLVEISDNVVRFPDEVRRDLIQRAIRDHGLTVLGEIGSKKVETSAEMPASLWMPALGRSWSRRRSSLTRKASTRCCSMPS